MTTDGHRPAIDFGTSTTVAMVTGRGGGARPLLFDASPLPPSAVFAARATGLLTGVDAERAAVASPAAFEANPKRCVGDGTVWLGEREVPVVDLVAEVLGRVAGEARRALGGPAGTTVLTHPAGWAAGRLAVLAEAAARAGLGGAGLVPEPVAAAAYYATVLGGDLPAGRCLVVYDLGAGTFDVSVVRAGGPGFVVLAAAGLDDVGGLDLDAAVVAHARALTPGAGEAWGRLEWPQTAADRQARHALWCGARAAREQLSRHPMATLHVPLAGADLHLTREELEGLARAHLDRTVALTVRTLRDAGVARADVAAVLLVGGASRTPLAATLLHRALRIAPTTVDQPELAVAEGGLHTPRPVTRPAPAPAPPPLPALPLPALPAPAPAAPAAMAPARRRSGSGLSRAVAILVAAAVMATTSAAAVPAPIVIGGRPRLVATLTGHTGSVQTVAFSPDGTLLATGGNDKTVRLWSPATGRTVRRLAGHTHSVEQVAFSPDGRTLATASLDRTLRLWNVATGGQLWQRTDESQWLCCVAFSPDGRTLATGGADRVVRLHDAATGGLIKALAPHSTGLGSVAIAKDGTVASAGRDDMNAPPDRDDALRLWRLPTGDAVGGLYGEPRAVSSVGALTFSPDGRLLAVSAQDDKVRFWDTATREEAGRLSEPVPTIAPGLAFSPDGTVLALSAHHKVTLARVATGATISTFTAAYPYTRAMAFGPGGRLLAVAGDGAAGTVQLWLVAG